MSTLIRIFQICWVSPNSLLGATCGVLGLISGGNVQLERGCLEFYGGFVAWCLKRIPPCGIMAMTLGHTIVGQSQEGLAIAREHEHVHVRQYERWGPFFIPAYLLCSGYLFLQKRECYRNNPFEIEAYAIDDPHRSSAPPDE